MLEVSEHYQHFGGVSPINAQNCALIDALTAGIIAGAGIDVYDLEPLAADHPIRTAPNCLTTPHIGYVTKGVYRAFYGQMVESISAWMDGNPVRVLA